MSASRERSAEQEQRYNELEREIGLNDFEYVGIGADEYERRKKEHTDD